MNRYWLTPPELEPLREGRFDPYPFPHEFGDFNALLQTWKKPWYANPPFRGITKHVRRAIEQGGPGILVMPVHASVALVIESGLTMEYIGKVKWLEADTFRRDARYSTHTVKVVFP